MMFIKQKTSKDASVYSYEDNLSPTQGYSATEKQPVLAYDYVEDVQETVEDIGGLSISPASVGNNSVFQAAIEASISGGLAIVTLWRNGFSDFSIIKFQLQKGYNEIAAFTDESLDQVDLTFEGLYGNIVGGWQDNFFLLRAGVSSGGLLV